MRKDIEELQEGHSISRRREGDNVGYGGLEQVPPTRGMWKRKSCLISL
jgi:hypothetical protein